MIRAITPDSRRFPHGLVDAVTFVCVSGCPVSFGRHHALLEWRYSQFWSIFSLYIVKPAMHWAHLGTRAKLSLLALSVLLLLSTLWKSEFSIHKRPHLPHVASRSQNLRIGLTNFRMRGNRTLRTKLCGYTHLKPIQLFLILEEFGLAKIW